MQIRWNNSQKLPRLRPRDAFLSLIASLACVAPALAQDQTVSPLAQVMAGQEAARQSMLTEAGGATLAQAGTNTVLFIAGGLSILLTLSATFDLYRAANAGDGMQADDVKRAAWWRLGMAGMIAIPAIISMIMPKLLLW